MPTDTVRADVNLAAAEELLEERPISMLLLAISMLLLAISKAT